MNYLILTDDDGGTTRLTTEHAASSYKIPVLVIEAEDVAGVFGPADLIGDSGISGADVVAAWGRAPERTDHERDAARRYLQQWPDGPQIAE